VVIPMVGEHWVMLQKNLLYTAVTRGRRLVVLVTQPRALRRAVQRQDGLERYTALARRLWAA
ncbi:MAG: ATP-binding domain-containing protein, partial [Myxococcales bacterium]|nr:ATP-binding domain-containing protein [Myxococcales bacterium]